MLAGIPTGVAGQGERRASPLFAAVERARPLKTVENVGEAPSEKLKLSREQRRFNACQRSLRVGLNDVVRGKN